MQRSKRVTIHDIDVTSNSMDAIGAFLVFMTGVVLERIIHMNNWESLGLQQSDTVMRARWFRGLDGKVKTLAHQLMAHDAPLVCTGMFEGVLKKRYWVPDLFLKQFSELFDDELFTKVTNAFGPFVLYTTAEFVVERAADLGINRNTPKKRIHDFFMEHVLTAVKTLMNEYACTGEMGQLLQFSDEALDVFHQLLHVVQKHTSALKQMRPL